MLIMGQKKAVSRELRDRYQKSSKKEKTIIIEYHAFTGVVLTLTDYRLSRLAGNLLSSPP